MVRQQPRPAEENHDGGEGDSSGPAALIWARGLTKRFGDSVAVHGLDLEVPPGGKVYGLVGPSGCGKTTTVRLLAGILAPTSGALRVFGAAPDSFSAAMRARLGYMPQLSALYPHLTVGENLNFMASIYAVPLRRRERLRAVLDFVELGEHRSKLVRELSGGMQRRLALAASLLHEPQLLFLDEPTAGVDPVLRRRFWDGFAELKRAGRTLFVTTQYVTEATYCDLVALMADGRLVAMDTPQGLRRQAFGGDVLELVVSQPAGETLLDGLRALPYVVGAEPAEAAGRVLRVVVDRADTAGGKLQRWFEDQPVRLTAVQHHQGSFDDVFVALLDRLAGGE